MNRHIEIILDKKTGAVKRGYLVDDIDPIGPRVIAAVRLALALLLHDIHDAAHDNSREGDAR